MILIEYLSHGYGKCTTGDGLTLKGGEGSEKGGSTKSRHVKKLQKRWKETCFFLC